MYDKHLETFIKVAQAGSFNKAAQELFLSPNAVMKQVNLLEQRLGLSLFERTHKGIVLTKAGELIYKDALYIVDYASKAVQNAHEATDRNSNVIRIGTSLTTPVNFLVKLWPRIAQIEPGLSFELISFENTQKNAQEIMNNFGKDIDLVAGIYNDNLLERRNCQALEIIESPVKVALAVDHPFASKMELSISDLSAQKIMVIQLGYMETFDKIRDFLNRQAVEPEIVDFPFYDISVFNQCVKEKSLLLCVGQWENIHPLIKMVPVRWDFTIPYGIIYSLHPSNKVELFIKALKKAYYD